MKIKWSKYFENVTRRCWDGSAITKIDYTPNGWLIEAKTSLIYPWNNFSNNKRHLHCAIYPSRLKMHFTKGYFICNANPEHRHSILLKTNIMKEKRHAKALYFQIRQGKHTDRQASLFGIIISTFRCSVENALKLFCSTERHFWEGEQLRRPRNETAVNKIPESIKSLVKHHILVLSSLHLRR